MELSSSHNPPAHDACVNGESSVHNNARSGAGIEEELKSDNEDASKHGWNHLGLMDTDKEEVSGIGAFRDAFH